MTPVEAHKYKERLKIDIWEGPGYHEGRREKSFDGFGWHDGLLRSFKGPKDYRDYLKENNLVEAGLNDRPVHKDFTPPTWTEELIWKAINVHKIEIGGLMAEALLKGEMKWPDGSE
jgi:hypothetical protein